MDLRRLEIFAKGPSSGIFSRAAEAMFPPSHDLEHIAPLRTELGVQLLDRLGRGARRRARAS